MKSYIYRAILPMLAVLFISLIMLLTVLWSVSVVEERKGRVGVFDIELSAIDAPLWILIVAGLFLANGITMAKWAIITASIRRQPNLCYELNIPFPLGKMAAMNIFYVGTAIIAFFALRGI